MQMDETLAKGEKWRRIPHGLVVHWLNDGSESGVTSGERGKKRVHSACATPRAEGWDLHKTTNRQPY
jgi:hypothetical protein